MAQGAAGDAAAGNAAAGIGFWAESSARLAGGETTMYFKRTLCTLQLMLFALLPGAGGVAAPPGTGEVKSLAPSQIRGGMARFLDDGGKFQVFFPDCLAIAAPFVLFRLKREGFSSCFVEASVQGLYVQGRR